ncbi:MAG: ABC transporter permease [Bdellovibrionota bacterium]
MNTLQSFSAVAALCKREFIRFLRQRSRVVGAFLTPLIFWLMLGMGIDGASDSAAVGMAANFKQFFIPGMMVMGILFTAIYSAISLIEDKNSGFYQGVMVSPLATWAIVLSKILGAAFIALFQGLLLLPLVYLNGLSLSLPAFGSVLLLFFFIGFFIASLALHFGWKIESVAGFHGIMNTVLMPMWFLSGATFPIKSGPLYWVSRANPLTYAVKSFQDILFVQNYASFGLALVVLGVSSLLLFSLSMNRR